MRARKNNWVNLLVLSLMTLALAACGNEEVETIPVIRPVKVITVGNLEEGLGRAFPGQVIANTSAELAFRVSGQIVEWPITEGQEMEKGDLIAKLDQRDFRAAVQRANSNYKGAIAVRKEAESSFKRGQQLLPSGAIAQATFDEMQANFDNAKAREASLAQELRTARLNLEYTTLSAPFDGVVSKKYVKNFSNVQQGQPIVKFEDIKAIDIVIEIPEFVWGRLAKARAAGKKVARSLLAYFDAHPDHGYPVTLKEYQTTANPETQTYSVRLTMPQPEDFQAYPGMTAKVEADLINIEADGYSVPIQAVFGGNDGTKFVWTVKDDMTVEKIQVETGEMIGADISISSGLKGGEKIVVAGVNTLQPGQEVSLLSEKE